MKYSLKLIILLVAILSCGFTFFTEEDVKAREELCAQIISVYGEVKLNEFIQSAIKEVKEAEGIEFKESALGEEWEALDWNPFWHIISGEWALKVEEETGEKFNDFTCLWMADESQGVMIKGFRKDSGELVREKVWVEEMVQINWR